MVEITTMLVTLLIVFSIPEVKSQLSAHGPHCLSCDAVAFPDQCLNVVRCKENEQCYTHRIFHNHRNIFYKLGCMQKDECSVINTILGPIGRSTSTNELQCAECCPDNFCNLHQCSITNIAASGFINCMNCQHITDAAENCHMVRPCGPGKSCYARYTDEFRLVNGVRKNVLDVGCWSSSECDVAKNTTTTGCMACCDTPFCNMHLCDEHQL